MGGQLPRRIGINAIFLLPHMGGLVTYVRELVPELLRAAPEASVTLYCSPAGKRYLSASDWAGSVRWSTPPLVGRRGLKAVSELTVLGALAGRQVDLLHSMAMTAPLATRAANVVTIADTIWLKGDAPDLTTRLWRAIVPPVARRADRVIAISQAAAQEIREQLRVPPERIDVTLLGHRSHARANAVSEGRLRGGLRLGDGPLVLMVGTRKPHKNVLGLLRAMPAVLAVRPDAKLVLTGNPTSHETVLRGEADRLGLDGSVRFIDHVDSDQLEGLYAAATCLVLPSLTEGFGLPVLEAMGRGVPVACSNRSALPEVAGNAARYFDPTRPEEIAAAVIEILSDPALRDQMRARGLAREAELTWAATATATLESYAHAWAAHRG